MATCFIFFSLLWMHCNPFGLVLWCNWVIQAYVNILVLCFVLEYMWLIDWLTDWMLCEVVEKYKCKVNIYALPYLYIKLWQVDAECAYFPQLLISSYWIFFRNLAGSLNTVLKIKKTERIYIIRTTENLKKDRKKCI